MVTALLLLPLLGLSIEPVRAADNLTIDHAQGATDVPKNPKTVLVFDPASLDTLDILNVHVTGVPSFPIPKMLSKYSGDAYKKIGSLFEPDLEAVNALHPDLIIVAGRSAPKYDVLSRIAPTIDLSIDPARFLESAEANARILGRIFNKQAEVEERLKALDSSVQHLRGETAGIGAGLIVLTTGNRISAYGPGSRFGILHTAFGIKPAAPNLKPSVHGEVVSFEYILKTNPDWLFVIDRDAAIGHGSAAKILDNPLVGATNAWKNGHVVMLDPASWYLLSGGLRALQQSVDQIAEAVDRKQN
jgi:iron complex transport system substrate-binding protein